ncbi:auxilin-related protein 1-like [Gastrolobium bilobum]|uniref:auxilin-related protein 1-like n=1 Tax=Gastrolobium bilobum TaxID=150636 RepID=UPI002AAF5998|nr:auxilin-related protein 1-like [Gastrolobium bilobum]
MDEFGVLTERFGLKPQGKSAPMASSKRPTNVGDSSRTATFGTNSGLNPKSSQNGSRSHQNSTFDFDYGSSLDDLNSVLSSSNKKTQHSWGPDDGIDDIFGGNAKSNVANDVLFDYDSIFAGSNKSVSTSSSSPVYVDDIFGGMPEQNDPLDKIGGLHANAKSSNEKAPDFDDLIPGFGGSSVSNNGKASNGMNNLREPTVPSNKTTVMSHTDPFLVFETASSTASSESFLDSLEQISKLNNSKGTRGSSSTSPSLRSPPKPTDVSNSVNNSSMSSIDELEDFAMGRVQNNASRKANVNTDEIKQNSVAKTNNGKRDPAARMNQLNNTDYLESFFSTGSRSSSVPKSRTATMDHTFDHQMNNKGKPEVSQRVPSGFSSSVKKPSVMTSLDDLSLIFGASPSSEFEEVEGETEERRNARLGRHQRTQERALKAVADMNQRDLQTKMEQEERRRIADTADVQIKRWAAGKEGNMRALLSTLQYVLWPECGWEPISLTDMITSSSVKKVYRKATLCIHPDKVQQKGANLEQKYTAEKVFDILKEAWNKFNAEELS